ncbi:MAG: NADH-quinone oxidoreductase subunit C [Anaerolineales bacterium]|jgi:NADH-quinone oxidoreductase subunit C
MTDHLQNAVQAIQERYAVEIEVFRGETTLILSKDQLVDTCRTLREELDFNFLPDITAVDYWPNEQPRFFVVYQLHCLQHNVSLRLRVPLPGKNPSLPTIEEIYPNANWLEREVWDMFGIRFDGHSDLRRILMPYDWEGHPLRKDYPLGYEEVQFTFNFEEIDLRKPYVKE